MPRKSFPNSSRLPLIRMTDTPAVSRNVFITHCSRLRLRRGRNRTTSSSTPHDEADRDATIIPGNGPATLRAMFVRVSRSASWIGREDRERDQRADHEELAVGEVGDVHHPEHEREAAGHERPHAARHEGVHEDRGLDERERDHHHDDDADHDPRERHEAPGERDGAEVGGGGHGSLRSPGRLPGRGCCRAAPARSPRARSAPARGRRPGPRGGAWCSRSARRAGSSRRARAAP